MHTDASEGRSCTGIAITFLFIGLGAGALTALLLAPRSGRRLRKDLRRHYRDARDAFDELKDDARDFAEDAIERGTDIAGDIRDKVTPLARAVRKG